MPAESVTTNTNLVQNVSFDELALVHDAPNSSYFETHRIDRNSKEKDENKIKICAGTEQIIEIEINSREEQIC